MNGDTLDRKLALDILQVYYSNEVQTWEKIFYLYEKKDVKSYVGSPDGRLSAANYRVGSNAGMAGSRA